MSKADRLWARYWGIRDNYQIGHRMPILWHLALNGDTDAMVELGSELGKVSRIADRFSQAALPTRHIAAATLWVHSIWLWTRSIGMTFAVIDTGSTRLRS